MEKDLYLICPFAIYGRKIFKTKEPGHENTGALLIRSLIASKSGRPKTEQSKQNYIIEYLCQ
jgi:hypothetical protein